MKKFVFSFVAAFAVAFLFAYYPTDVRAEKFPADMNYINVTASVYGAIPDDGQDDTAAINAAISAGLGKDATIYFPCGVYDVTGQIAFRQVGGSQLWSPRVTLLGEGRSCVRLKLQDSAAGFTNPSAPKSFIETGGLNGADGPATNSAGVGNRAFQNNIIDMTIDCGTGNLGVRCVDFLANNQGTIRNVTIESPDGLYGIYLGRTWPGPCLIEDVTVIGFSYGVWMGQLQYGVTFLNLSLSGQLVYGFELGSNAAWIEGFSSINAVPAIHSTSKYGYLVLVGAEMAGGNQNKYAIDVAAETKFYVRDVHSSGYASAMRRGGTVVPGELIAESTSNPVHKLFDAPDGALKLPVPPIPASFTSDPDAHPEDWANVLDYGAGNGAGGEVNDDSAGIQAAMDSGKPIIYFPRKATPSYGYYKIAVPVNIPPTTRRIILGGNYFTASGINGCPFEISVGTAADPAVEIEYLRRLGGASNEPPVPYAWICNTSPGRRVVVRRSTGVSYKGIGTGSLYALDNVIRTDIYDGHRLFAWQYNNEYKLDAPHEVDGEGTVARILGYKSETDFTKVTATNGASAEVLGALALSCVGSGTPTQTSFVSVDSKMSVSAMEWCQSGNTTTYQPVFVSETRNGETRELAGSDLVNDGFSGNTRVLTVLFNGYEQAGQIATGNVLFVVGNTASLENLDAKMAQHMLDAGLSVDLIDDNDVNSSSACGYDLVIISRSVLVAKVDTALRAVAVPVVNMETYLQDAARMDLSTTQSASGPKTKLTIVAPDHPIAAGLSGEIDFYTAPATLGYGRVVSGGTNIALVEGLTNHFAVYAYDTGEIMADDFSAPARRVGFYADENAADLTSDGWKLFDGAVLWALGQ